MRRFIVVAVGLGCALVLLAAQMAQSEPPQPVNEILKSRGAPSLIASGFKAEKLPDGLMQISFYEVTKEKDPAKMAAKDLHPGLCMIYTKDDIFADDVRAHFHGLAHPEQFSGSTMWATLDESVGAAFEVITIGSDSRGTVAFKGKVHIAYLEEGARGHVIRRPVKITPAQPKSEPHKPTKAR
jgi:hypothetical protein